MINETYKHLRSWPAPWAALGLVVSVCAVEGSLARNAHVYRRFEGWDWALGRKAGQRAGGAGVVCFGDSLMKFGVQPRLLEGRLGLRAYNLALCAGTAPASYFQLRRVLGSGDRPSAVLVDFNPYFLSSKVRSAERPCPWGELLGPREVAELALDGRDPDLFAATMLEWALPSVRGRHELRALVKANLAGGDYSDRDRAFTYLRNWNRNLGAHVHAATPHAQDPPVPDDAAARYSGWACDPVQRRYVHKFLALAGSASVPVFWLLPPACPGVQAAMDRGKDVARYDEFVRSVRDGHPGVVVLDARRSGYPAPAFVDVAHLNGRGAAALSRDVADAIARRLDGDTAPAWVMLPAYREPPPDTSAEDTAQSALAFKEALKRAR